MLNTFKAFTLDVRLKSINDILTIYFFGDVHRFVQSCDVDAWKRFLKDAQAAVNEKPDSTFFFGMGDYDDFASTREKQELLKLHETTLESLDEVNQRRTRVMAKELQVMKGRTIGLIEGNHHWIYDNGRGDTTTMDLAKRLETNYLGYLSHVTLRIKFGKTDYSARGRSTTVDIVAHHGKAGGKRAGSSINQVEDLKDVFPAADIYVMGHDHKLGAWPYGALFPYLKADGTYAVRPRKQLLCRSGSFKLAYGDGQNAASYEIGRVLKPSALGALRVDVKFRRDYKNGGMIVTDFSAVS